MSRSQDLRLLELETGANFVEVEEAYRRLMRRYSIGGLASYGLLRVEDRRRFLILLQESYQRLCATAHETQVDDEPRKHPSFPDLTPFSPESVLRAQEEQSGQGLEEGDRPLGLLLQQEPSPSRGQEEQEQGVSRRVEEGHLSREPKQASGVNDDASRLERASLQPEASLMRQAQTQNEVGVVGVRESIFAWEGPFSGARLRQIREEKAISVEWIAGRSGLAHEKIAALEAERYELLGSSRQIRAVLTFYTRALDLDPRQVFIDYLASYWGWRSREGMRRS